MLRIHVNCQSVFLAPDLPPGTHIVAHGRGAGLEIHPSDVIVMVKRNAADDTLSQDFLRLCNLSSFNKFNAWMFRRPCSGPIACVPISILGAIWRNSS